MDFNQNHFELFGLPVDYAVNAETLRDRYLELQRELHPDRHARGSAAEQRLGMQWATQVNTAHETLADPLRRAIYMLELAGGQAKENPELPQEFLFAQIELREELEALEEGDDPATQRLDGTTAFKTKVKGRLADLEGNFAGAIGADVGKAETIVYEMQFFAKLLKAADQLEEKLLDY